MDFPEDDIWWESPEFSGWITVAVTTIVFIIMLRFIARIYGQLLSCHPDTNAGQGMATNEAEPFETHRAWTIEVMACMCN